MPSEPWQDHGQTAPVAGRRQVTALSYDLVGSTRLSALLDPEDFAELQRSFHDVCLGAVRRCGGHIDDIKGDGGLVYFGYPKAHEDDVERALRAGLEILSGCERLNQKARGKHGAVAVRVGIATGLVAVADFAPGESVGGGEVVGLAPNLAFKLQKAAEPNCVLISATTHELAGALFEYRDAGEVLVGGMGAPQRAWRLLRERPFALRFQATRAKARTPLVSREDELGVITRRWLSARQADGQVVLIAGEPGIGKSRLADAAKYALAGNGSFRLSLQCSAQHANTALHPLISRLDHALEMAPSDWPTEKLERLERLLAQVTPRVESVVSLIALLLEMPTGKRYPPFDLSPEQIRERLQTFLMDVVAGLGKPHPWLIVIEDLQWIDPSSEELLDQVVQRVQRLPGLLILTFRPEYAPRWVGQPHVTLLTLNRLSRRHSTRIIEHIACDRVLPPGVVEQIADKADGIPLFVEELTHAVIEARAALGDETAPLHATVKIPTTLYDSLMARLDQLGSGKEIVQVGSAIGRRFSLELARRVVDVDVATAGAHLDKLVALGLASVDRHGPHPAYTFKHALIQEAAHQSMLRGRRQAVHRRIAEVLQAEFAGTRDAEPEVLAAHFSEAGLVREAVAKLHEAGRIAAAKSGNVEAIRLLESALQLLVSLPQSPERDGLELHLLVALGPVKITTVGPGAPGVELVYQRAVELCNRLPRTPTHFMAYWGWWRVALNADEMRRRADLLSTFAATLDDEQLRLQAHHCQWGTLFNLGEHEACCEHVSQGLALYDAGDYRLHGTLYGGHDPKVCALGERALSLWLLGYPDQAMKSASSGVAYAIELRHSGSIGHARDLEIMLYRYRDDPEGVLEKADAMMAFAEAEGLSDLAAKAKIFKGWALAARGSCASGIALMNEGLTEERVIGTQEDFPVYYEMLAEVHSKLGQPEQGMALVDEALTTAERTGARYWSAELFRRKGDLLLKSCALDVSEAIDCFDRAITVAQSQNARTLLLRAVVSKAQVLATRHRRAEARQLLEVTCASLPEEFGTVDLCEARRLLYDLA